MGKTLLEIAKEVGTKINGFVEPNQEELDVVIAWFNQEITSGQAAKVLHKTSDGTLWQKASSVLKSGLVHGYIKKIERIK